ncbi:hypothetical protein FIBSPDRAFT_895276 [Athelia psychrophila]|uniref:Uncharacterized protein n=1 Tax=Athelia psychrophila TaxID=1759441 RepID=A0A166ESS1_9AGAM|nr:hypothetical protein FIBSPDRAFT_895276 [Fibularhizoctonia sp. CBS 109695]
MFHTSLLLAATNHTTNTDIDSIPPIEQDIVDRSEFAISPRCNMMELLSAMRMYSQTLTRVKHSHAQQTKRLAAALESLYHRGIAHHLLTPAVLNTPNLHISNLRHAFTRYVLPTTRTYQQCETRGVAPPKPFSAATNAEEREDKAWPLHIQVISTTAQSGVEKVLDMTLPTTPSKVSVHAHCPKPSQTPSAPRARKGRKIFFVMSAMRLTSRMLTVTNETTAGPALYRICPVACDHYLAFNQPPALRRIRIPPVEQYLRLELFKLARCTSIQMDMLSSYIGIRNRSS